MQDRERSRSPLSPRIEPTVGVFPQSTTETASTLDLEEISVAVTSDDPRAWVLLAAHTFRKYGVVILKDLISARVTDEVWKASRDLHDRWGGTYDPEKVGNRCPGRYDQGSAYDVEHLSHLPGYLEALEEFAGKGGLQLLEQLGGYKFVGGQGTLILANTDNWQPLHSDCYQAWHRDLEDEPEHVPCIDLMFTVHPLTSTNGAMRILPGQPSWDKIHKQSEFPPPKLDTEPLALRRSQLYPLPAGYGIMRDIRIWHGGVPNTSDEDRHFPVLQFYSDRALKLCGLDRGGGIVEEDLHARLSEETRKVVAPEIVLRPGGAAPRLMGKAACWPGSFGY